MFNEMKIYLFLLSLILTDIKYAFSYNDLSFEIYRSNGRTYTVEYLQNEEGLQYPRNNTRILKTIKKMWDSYYACLEKKSKEEPKPEIRRLIEGQYTEFKCDICHRPFHNYEEIEWKYKPIFSKVNVFQFEHLDLTPQMTLTEKKHLKMYNIQEDFAGIYVCYHGKFPVSAYILEVAKSDEIQQVDAHYANSDDRSDLQIPFLQTYRMWSGWTECSSCEMVGRRFKYGSCMVTIRKNQNKCKCTQIFPCKYSSNRNKHIHRNQIPIPLITATKIIKKLNKRESIRKLIGRANERLKRLWNKKPVETNKSTAPNPEDFGFSRAMVSAFDKGIPCMSPILPKLVFDTIDEDSKAVQAVTQYCWDSCHQIQIFKVRDGKGNVIETANNSAGIYSLFQKIPQLPPEIERRTVVAEFGKDIIIRCPGTTLKNIPVTWKIKRQIILPSIIANESNGRFSIDLINRIHLKKLRLKDNHIYSCWQRDKLVGTVHLNVEKKFTITLDHHVMLCLAVMLVGFLLFIVVKLFKKEIEMIKK